MQITVLGCDGSWPSPGGACSSYLLETESTSIWIDAGHGSFANLQRHINPQSLDGVVITHRHADHSFDLNALFVYGICGQPLKENLLVLAAEGVRESVFLAEDPLDDHFDWQIVNDGDVHKVGDVALAFSRTDHGPPTFAVLAQVQDVTFAYSADTGPAWSFAAFESPIDLAICAAAYSADQEGKPNHLSARQAGAMAAAAAVKRLVLSHLRPTLDVEAAQRDGSIAFGHLVEMAQIDAVYKV